MKIFCTSQRVTCQNSRLKTFGHVQLKAKRKVLSVQNEMTHILKPTMSVADHAKYFFFSPRNLFKKNQVETIWKKNNNEICISSRATHQRSSFFALGESAKVTHEARIVKRQDERILRCGTTAVLRRRHPCFSVVVILRVHFRWLFFFSRRDRWTFSKPLSFFFLFSRERDENSEGIYW